MTRALREDPDSTLVAATKNRENHAFEFLVKRHETKIFAIAFRITRNREDAQDVVQQSFYKAFVHLDSFQGKSSFSTWLPRIAINEALMCLRKNRTLSEVSFEDMETERETVFPTETVDTGEGPAEIYEQHEKQRIFFQAMNQLNSELRKTLFLRLEDGTLEETAEILGVATGTLKARLFRARQQLRVLLARDPQFQRGRAIHKTRRRRELDVNPHVPIAAVSCG